MYCTMYMSIIHIYKLTCVIVFLCLLVFVFHKLLFLDIAFVWTCISLLVYRVCNCIWTTSVNH